MTKDLNSKGDIYDISEAEENAAPSEITYNSRQDAQNLCTNIEFNKQPGTERVNTEDLGPYE